MRISVISAAERYRKEDLIMAELWEMEYLALLAEWVEGLDPEKKNFADIYITDAEENPALILVPAVEEDGFSDIQLRISITHILENTEQIQILTTMFGGVPENLLREAEKVIARINEFLILGNAAIFYEGGLIFFNHAFVIDQGMDTLLATSLVGKTLEIITKTVPQIMEILTPVLEGTKTADAVIADGIGLIQ